MKLARFIETNMERLLEDWEQAVVEIAPELKGKDSVTLRDHACEMLVFITEDLMTSQTDGESALKALGKGKALLSEAGEDHGTQRQGQGLSIHQVTRLFETMLKASPDPAAVFDPDGKYLFLNDSMADLVDKNVRDVIGKTPREEERD